VIDATCSREVLSEQPFSPVRVTQPEVMALQLSLSSLWNSSCGEKDHADLPKWKKLNAWIRNKFLECVSRGCTSIGADCTVLVQLHNLCNLHKLLCNRSRTLMSLKRMFVGWHALLKMLHVLVWSVWKDLLVCNHFAATFGESGKWYNCLRACCVREWFGVQFWLGTNSNFSFVVSSLL